MGRSLLKHKFYLHFAYGIGVLLRHPIALFINAKIFLFVADNDSHYNG
jgi:hypothetical protein